MAKPGDVASGAFENWLIRKEFDDAKEMLRDMKARKLKASWREVGKAVANVHATYAVLVEPFRHELPDKDVKDYLEACAMGWKPERNLQQEFIGWLSAHLDESDKFNTVTMPISQEDFDALPDRFKRLLSPVPDSSDSLTASSDSSSKLLFRYYATAAWAWCVSEGGHEIVADLLPAVEPPRAVFQRHGIDALKACYVQSQEDSELKASLSTSIRKQQADEAFHNWKADVDSRPKSSPSKRPMSATATPKRTSRVLTRPASSPLVRTMSPVRTLSPTRKPLLPLPRALSEQEQQLGEAERSLREALTALKSRLEDIDRKRLTVMALDPDSLAGKYTNVSENLALLRQHSHEIMIEIAKVRAELGETLLWMTASPKWFREQRDAYKGAMRTEAGSHLSKAQSYLTAVADAGTVLSLELQATCQRCEELLGVVDAGDDAIVHALATGSGVSAPASPSKPVFHGAINAEIADAMRVLFRRLGSRQDDGEFVMKSDKIGILLTELGCYPPPTPTEVAAIAKQVNPHGADSVTFSEFVKWYNIEL